MSVTILNSKTDWIAIAIFGALSTIALGIVDFAPRYVGANTAVIFPPWTDAKIAASQAASAGATLIQSGRYPFIIIVRPLTPDYASRARAAGALITVDARGLSGCFLRSGGPA